MRGLPVPALLKISSLVGLSLLKRFTCFALASLSPLLSAQDLPDVAQGLQPYVAYHGGELDKVSTLNGGLTVRIPLVSYPQKGSLSLSYSVIFNSFGFQDLGECFTTPDPNGPVDTIPLRVGCHHTISLAPIGLPGSPPPGPRFVMDQQLSAGGSSGPQPFVNYMPPIEGRFYVITADNAQHPLAPSSGAHLSVDGSGYRFAPSTPPTVGVNLGATGAAYPGDVSTLMIAAQGVITDSRGIVYTPSSMVDPDGNSIQVNPTPNILAVDSIGRTINAPATANIAQCPSLANALFQPVTSATSWDVPGPGGTVQYLFCYAAVNIRTHFFVDPKANGGLNFVRQETMLQSIKLPNGTFWGFVYDSDDPNSNPEPSISNLMTGLGQLMTLVYPTGGSVSYTYGLSGGFCEHQRTSGLTIASLNLDQPVVATRTLSDQQGKGLGSWTYTYPEAGPDNGSILSPAGELTVTKFIGVPVTANGQTCQKYDVGQDIHQSSSASSPVLQSTTKTLTFYPVLGVPFVAAPLETKSVTTLDDGTSSSVTTSYDSGVPFGVIDCDPHGQNCNSSVGLGSPHLPIGGPILTVTQGFDGAILKQEGTSYQWRTNSDYLTANLIDLPAQKSILDSSGTTISSTSVSYDETAYSPGGVRGHLTTTTRALYQNSGPAPATHSVWNASGEMSASIDAKGNTTSHLFNQCNGSVATDSYDALNHHTSGVYDCNTGQLTSLTDPNGQTTQIAYDNMRRLQSVTSPAVQLSNGQTARPMTSFAFNDAQNTVTRTVLGAPDPDQTTKVIYDAFGRESQRLTADSQGPIEVDTSYDLNGRTNSVTNPYRPGNGTIDTTTTNYDALNRKLRVTEPDGSLIRYEYTGAKTDTWDEAQVHTQHVSDALGRLVQVMELGTSANPTSLETDYVYTPLGDLKGVNQLGAPGDIARTRSFSYDSLSRLITSYNPETGTICYGVWTYSGCQSGYDANGNLSYKTDARGLTTSYTYDALNRLTFRISSTQYASFTYDSSTAGNFTGTNEIGRLNEQSNSFNASTQYSYDAMGRVIYQGNTLPQGCCDQNANPVHAAYDLAGNMTSLTYPDGHTVTQTYDNAGHLKTVGDGTNSQTYLQSIAYNADGSPNQLTLGNGIVQKWFQNNRLQVTGVSVADGITGANYLSHTYCYVNCPSGGPANNGNIWQITDNLSSPRTQSFTYDNLNRISSFALGGVPTQQYTIDSFGNLSGMDGVHPIMTFDPATNRTNNLSCATWPNTYDAAGNQLCDTDPNGLIRQYTYNAENQISYINSPNQSPFEAYFYGADGARVRKNDALGSFTEYVNFNGQPIAEKDETGAWTDYIFAGGKRIAAVAPTRTAIHMHGVRDNTTNPACGTIWSVSGQASSLVGYTIQANDTASFDHLESRIPVDVAILFTDGSFVQTERAADGSWHHDSIDLSGSVRKTVYLVAMGPGAPYNAQGTWDSYVRNAVLASADGTVHPIFTGGPASGYNWNGCGSNSLAFEVVPIALGNTFATNFYVGDHLGSAQMEFSASGAPLSMSQFMPFGDEINPPVTSNHFKFTGKERDAESGLDYFGARYYASSMGRFMSPDWVDKPEAVPYSDLANPQSLNLYSYVKNNPLRSVDPDGHDDEAGDPQQTSVVTAPAPAPVAVQTPTASDWQLVNEAGASVFADVGSIFVGAIAVPFMLTKDAGNWNDDHPNAQTRDGRPPSATNPVITSSTQRGGAPGSRPGKDFTPAGKDEIDRRAGGNCEKCGKETAPEQNKKGVPTPPNQRQRHHKQHKKNQGSGTAENGELLCPACHKSKHNH